MKMKDAVSATGLTDRAIRLYIENGLLAPQIEKNYMGRKSLTFSPADIETLRQISLLRKAGFSLEQIRQVEESPAAAAEAVAVLLRQKTEAQALNEKVIAALSELPENEPLTMPLLASALKSRFEDQPAPEADLRLTAGEQAARIALLVVTVIGAAGAVVPTGLILFSIAANYKYPALDETWITLLPLGVLFFLFLVLAVASAVLLCFSAQKSVWRIGGPGSRRSVNALLLAALFVSDLFLLLGFAAYCFAPIDHSETEDPAYYLQTDDDVRDRYDVIYRVFPASIPREAADIRYYYRYAQGSYLDLYAAWRFPAPTPQSADPYEEEKARLRNLPGIVKTEQKGAWTCCFLIDEPQAWEQRLFCAWRDDTRSVRYYYGENITNPHFWYESGITWDSRI